MTTAIAPVPADEQLSPSFTLREFAVSKEHPELVKPVPRALVPRVRELARRGMQVVRDRIRRPMRILSGYRPDALNRAIGGSETSQHVVGEAGDFTCYDIRAAFLAIIDLVRENALPGIGQIIYYPDEGFVHMALASGRYPRPTLCVQWPAKHYNYRAFKADRRTFAAMVPEVQDPSARRAA